MSAVNTHRSYSCVTHWLSFFILPVLLRGVLSNDPDCPPQCHCVPNRMSCESPGLKHLPIPYRTQLEYLHVENQTFASTHLGPSELKVYQAPEFGGRIRLKSLFIRSCNIQTIGRFAFQELGPRLEVLDLTGNPLSHVDGYAFAGLGYLTLVLDKIDQPRFEDHAFSGLTRMKSLFMQYSRLETLPYQPLLHLTTEGKLDTLLVKGNRLQTLDEKFDVIFSKLHNFNINDNPWHCGCQLNWLIRRYQTVLRKRFDPVSLRSRRWDDGRVANSWGLEDSQPQCASPSFVFGRNFSDLVTDISDLYTTTPNSLDVYSSPTVLHCPPPKLETVEVNLNQGFQSGEHGKGLVELKCAMKGSKQLTILWGHHTPERGVQYIGERSANLSRAQFGSDLLPWSPKSESSVLVEAELRVKQYSDQDTYFCLGQDVIGNVSTTIRIRWPKTTEPSAATQYVATTTHSSRDVDQVVESSSSSDWNSEILLSSYSVLHAPQFSLSQLLGAIAGTFLSTALLFIIIHRSLHWHWHSCQPYKRHAGPKLGDFVSPNHGASPGETSSSNTSCNVKSVNMPKQGGLCPSPLANPASPESLSLTANLLNAHAYHQLVNGTAGLGFTPVQLDFGTSTPSTAPQMLQHTDCRALPQNFRLDHSANTLSTAYEPVSYADANNMTYDVPWTRGPSDRMQTRSLVEQRVPLLLSNPSSEACSQLEGMHPSNMGIIQSALMIPPPPSMPQPPPPPHSVAINRTLDRTGSSGTNLFVLQANYPSPNPPHLINPFNVSSAMTSAGCGKPHTTTAVAPMNN